jgi:hypothetical protein
MTTTMAAAGGGMGASASIGPEGKAPALREFYERGLTTTIEAGGVSPLGAPGRAPSPGRSVANEGGLFQTQLCATSAGELLRARLPAHAARGRGRTRDRSRALGPGA